MAKARRPPAPKPRAATPAPPAYEPGRISVIIPTVTGREHWLDKCAAAYQELTPNVDLVIVRDERSCGEAWIAGAALARGEFLHFTADDLAPLTPDWWKDALQIVQAGGLPGANVLTAMTRQTWGDSEDWDPDSTMHSTVYLHDGTTVQNVFVPFLSRAQLAAGVKAAEGDGFLPPIHYGSDDWVTFLAHALDYPIRFAPTYLFSHGAAPQGRLYDSRRRDIPILVDLMLRVGNVPQPYIDMAVSNGWQAHSGLVGRVTRGTVQVHRRANVEPVPATLTAPNPLTQPSYFWNGPPR